MIQRTTLQRATLAMTATTALLAFWFAFAPGIAVGQQKTIKQQIVGTWTFVSALDVKVDGTKTDRWGPSPKGIFIFDNTGHFAQFIMRSDLPKFAAKTAAEGTPAEYKAVMQGLVGSFGTYTVNEAEKTVTTHV